MLFSAILIFFSIGSCWQSIRRIQARHDAYALKHHGLGQMLDSFTLADKGYIGMGLATPARCSQTLRITCGCEHGEKVH